MSYIPPHKRQSKGGAGASSPPSPAPPPEFVIPRFNRILNLLSKNYILNYQYAENAKKKWFVVGLADESRVPDLTRLEPVAMGSYERNSGEKPLSLVLKENDEEISEFSKNPWDFIAETVKQDFFSSIQQIKDEMRGCELGEIKPTLILRFGKNLFHGNRFFTAESMIGSSPSTQTLKKMRKSFDSNIPTPFVEYITNDVVPQLDFKFKEKEVYQVKLCDKMQPDSTIACKCTVTKDTRQLQLFKIELKQLRNLVADMSCLDKNLDLRLILCTSRFSTALIDEENIKSLIESAILDPEVKGGLRWPLGKQSSGDRYTVVGVWHTNSKIFINSSVRLKIRHADRFDFLTSGGDVAKEVSLTMHRIVPLLREQTENTELAFEMFKENLEMIWKHFLVSGSFKKGSLANS